MGDDQAKSDLEQRVDQLGAEGADMRAALQHVQQIATDANNRADASEARASKTDHRADLSEARADQAELRADENQERESSHVLRMDAFEERLDVDEAMIADLQAEGLLSEQHARQLEQALRSSRLIGAAMGIIMANRQLDETQAFRLLSKASQNTNRKLRAVAEDIVHSGDSSALPTA